MSSLWYGNPHVHMHMSIGYLEPLVQVAQAFTNVFSFYRQQWNNDFLTWNTSKYGDIQYIHFAPDEIWVPDIALFNK